MILAVPDARVDAPLPLTLAERGGHRISGAGPHEWLGFEGTPPELVLVVDLAAQLRVGIQQLLFFLAEQVLLVVRVRVCLLFLLVEFALLSLSVEGGELLLLPCLELSSLLLEVELEDGTIRGRVVLAHLFVDPLGHPEVAISVANVDY